MYVSSISTLTLRLLLILQMKKYKNYSRIKIIRRYLTNHVSAFMTYLSGIDRKVNSKKVGTFRNIPTKVLKESSDACNSLFKNISHENKKALSPFYHKKYF